MAKSIKSIRPKELAVGKTSPVTFRGSGFNANHAKNRVVLKLTKTGAPSKHVVISEPLRTGHSSRRLRVKISSDQGLGEELSEIQRAEERTFTPAIELLDDANKVLETIDAPGDLVMVFTNYITSITCTPSADLTVGINTLVFVGTGFSKSFDLNEPVLKYEKTDYPAPNIEVILPPLQDSDDTSTSFRVKVDVKPLAEKHTAIIPTVVVDDGYGNKTTINAVSGLTLKVT